MRLPSRQMIALRLIVTLEISAVIDQAGWAAAALGGEPGYLRAHAVGAPVTLAVTVVAAVAYVVLRRHAGRVNTVLAVLTALTTGAQYLLGESGVRGAHIFLGVLLAMLVTALTSWTYRHDDTVADDTVADGGGARVE